MSIVTCCTISGARAACSISRSRDLSVHNPELTFATPGSRDLDRAWTRRHHPDRSGTAGGVAGRNVGRGIELFDVDQPGQGIVHVIGPELGLSLPGCLIVCGDSHTCTHGGLGALAFGIGSSELTHVLATQALIQRRPKTMRVRFEGKLPLGVTAKDLILALIGHVGAAGGTGYAVEYAGSAIRDLPVEGRLTICNLSIELGAKMGMVAPDEKTYRVHPGTPLRPARRDVGAGGRAWRQLPSDPMQCSTRKSSSMSKASCRR